MSKTKKLAPSMRSADRLPAIDEDGLLCTGEIVTVVRRTSLDSVTCKLRFLSHMAAYGAWAGGDRLEPEDGREGDFGWGLAYCLEDLYVELRAVAAKVDGDTEG